MLQKLSFSTTTTAAPSTASRRLRNIVVERYLSRRPHSLYEVKTKLSRLKERPSSSFITEATISLVKDKLLDDESFASFYTTSRVEHRFRSRRELVHELRVKGVDPKIIEKAISASLHDESSACDKAATKKPRSTHKELITYLLRKGFDYSTINETLKKREESRKTLSLLQSNLPSSQDSRLE